MTEQADLTTIMMEIKDFRRELNGRIKRLEDWRAQSEAADTMQRDEQLLLVARLVAVEQTTKEVAEIAAFTRTTAKIAKYVTTICGAVAAVAALVGLAQGWWM